MTRSWLDKIKSVFQRVAAWFRAKPRWARILLGSAASVLLLLWLFYLLLIWDVFGPVPGRKALREIEMPEASEVYAADSALLGKYFIENRTNVAYDEIAPHVLEALIVTEDERFYQHSGVDFRSWMRVLFKTILGGDRSAGGGSTITQQLAKNLYGRKNIGRFSIVINKLREVIIARRLEKVYSKEEILTMYLNTVPFGSNAFGLRAAARRYFNTTPAALTVEEGATLIGMLKATTTYNPLVNQEKATERRNLVLQLMADKKMLRTWELDSLVRLPMEVRPFVEDHQRGIGRYFRESLRLELDELLKGMQKPSGETYNLYTDGLRIYTSLDTVMQRYADEAALEHMERLQREFDSEWRREDPWGNESYITDQVRRTTRYRSLREQGFSDGEVDSILRLPVDMTVFTWQGPADTMLSPIDSIKHYARTLHCGMLVTDRQGFVKAWVGGIDFRFLKYDHVKARRQIGSTMKPVVYATAIEEGIDPCSFMENQVIIHQEFDNYTPKNVDARYGGQFTFAGALNRSINVIAVEVGIRAGIRNVINMAQQLGFKGPIPDEPGICLGGFDASLTELLEVYNTLSNRGRRTPVRTVLRIEDRHGNILVDFTREATARPQVLDTTTADMMLQLMKGVVERGTGASARWEYAPQWDLAGKTGTSQDYADGWFVGVTPDLLAGVWVGAESPLIHFRSSAYGQANHTALPIWGRFFRKITQDTEKRFDALLKARYPAADKTVRERLDCPPGWYEDELEPTDSLEGLDMLVPEGEEFLPDSLNGPFLPDGYFR